MCCPLTSIRRCYATRLACLSPNEAQPGLNQSCLGMQVAVRCYKSRSPAGFADQRHTLAVKFHTREIVLACRLTPS